MRVSLFVLAATAAGFGIAASSASAAVYDAVADFSASANPHGVWSYYGSNDATASPDNLLTAQSVSPPFLEVSNGANFDDWTGIIKNTSGSPQTLNTYTLPSDELNLDPQSDAVFVRFTAPNAGLYDINAAFYGLDSGARGVWILQNNDGDGNGTSLLPKTSESGTGWSAVYDDSLTLAAGDTLDFIVYSTGSASFLGTGLSARITSAPEPASLSLLALGSVGMLLKRRRK